MTPGVFARTYSTKYPDELFFRIRADGFTTTQFNLSGAGLAPLPQELPDGIAASIAHSAQKAGVTICALSGTYNMAHPDPMHRRSLHIGFANVMRAAREMGVPLVTLCTGSRELSDMWRAHPGNTSRQAWYDLRGELTFALALADEFDLMLGIEPEPGNIICDAVAARRMLDEVGSHRLGIVLDAANLLSPLALPRQQEIVAQATDLLGEHLLLVHAKDIDSSGIVVPAGKGAVDLPQFVARVRATGYDGPVVGHNFAEADAPGVAAYLQSIILSAGHEHA